MIAAMTLGNLLAIYAARHFRKMAYHALDRQTNLAKQLGFLPPYPMLWGYHVGLCSFAVVEIGILLIAAKILFW